MAESRSLSQEETLVEPDSEQPVASRWKAYSGLVVGVICLFSLVAWNLYEVCQMKQAEYEDKQRELKKLRRAVYTAEYTNQQLHARVAHLKTDSGVEEIAREKLGLLAPGEISFVVMPPPAAARQEGQNAVLPPTPEIPLTFYQKLLHTVFIGKAGKTLPVDP